MANGDKPPRTNHAEIENLIEQIRGTNLNPRAKEKVERLLNRHAGSPKEVLSLRQSSFLPFVFALL